MKTYRILALIPLFLAALLLAGCFGKVDRLVTNYYILDYKKATENPSLFMQTPFPKTLEVTDSEVNRTYARNQLVIKENFSRVRYLPYDVWANRLSDAVPNLIVQRFRAYNIFQQVDRSTGEIAPDYYLETLILNLEKIESEKPRAYLRMEFFLRDSATLKILLRCKAERFKDLSDDSMVYLVQSYNEMLMLETDIFAARCRMLLEGKPYQEKLPSQPQSPVEQLIQTQAQEASQMVADGELLLKLNTPVSPEIRYLIEELDASNSVLSRTEGEFNQEVTLKPGRYRVVVGENQEIPIYTEVKPKLRTVISGQWAELVVKIIDERQTRVRMSYDLWAKSPDENDFYPYGTDTSIGDDDLGQPDKVWILAAGTYMFKLGGGSWNDLRDFTTVNLSQGSSEVLTVVVDPTGEGNYLVGAGILGGDELAIGRNIVHKGAVHGNISLSSNNNVAQNEPTFSVNLTGQLDNSLDVKYPLTRFTARSIYDLGMSMATDSDLRISNDAYSLKNVFLFTPLEHSNIFKNFSLYGRADVNTHFLDETFYFSSNKNYILLTSEGDTLAVRTDQDRFRNKIAFYPMRLKEGTGLTYRLVINPKVTLSLRSGYGWQQEVNHRSFSNAGSGSSAAPGDTLVYEYYSEDPTSWDHGIESTLVFSAVNLLSFLSFNSTIDLLFPMDAEERSTRLDSENRINIRLYRNLSLDIKVNVQYDKSKKDWVVYDSSSFLRLSLYY